MEARAIKRHVRVSPRKAKLIADLVRGKSVERALEILKFSPATASTPILKTVTSAMHNLAGKMEHHVEPKDMGITSITIGEGRTMYRIKPRAQGRAYRIRIRSSHITVVVRHTGVTEA